jgi:hypothetical protein
MGPQNEITRRIVFNALRVADIGLVMLAFGAAAIVSVNTGKWTTVATVLASKVSLSSCVEFVIAILACHGVFSMCGLYQSKRMSTKGAEAAEVLRAMTVSTACVWCEAKLFFILIITPYFLVAFWAIGSPRGCCLGMCFTVFGSVVAICATFWFSGRTRGPLTSVGELRPCRNAVIAS